MGRDRKGKVEAKGLAGPLAGKGCVVGGAVIPRGVAGAPNIVSARE